MNASLELVLNELRKLSGAEPDVDHPDTLDGVTWIDAQLGQTNVTIEHRPQRGYGLYIGDDTSFGSGPNEIYRDVKTLVKRLSVILDAEHPKSAIGFSLDARKRPHLSLGELRELLGVTQVQLANLLGLQQSAISKLENRSDVLLSTLASWVKALGGKLEIRARFRQCDLPIEVAAQTRLDKPEDENTFTDWVIQSANTSGDLRREIVQQENWLPFQSVRGTNRPLKINQHKAALQEFFYSDRQPEKVFSHAALSKLLEQSLPIKLTRLDTDFHFTEVGHSFTLDGIGYSSNATYLIEIKANKAIDDLVEKTYALDLSANAFEKWHDELDDKFNIRKILIVPAGTTDCNVIRDIAILSFDFERGRFANLDQIVQEFPEWSSPIERR
jgi:transcriptional regulator with XRE-family HTH domain